MPSDYDRDYSPSDKVSSLMKPDQRLANAADYTAHHIGKISRNLEKLIAILEKNAKADGGTF